VRKLAAKLHQWQLDHEGKVLMLVSAVAGEQTHRREPRAHLSGSYKRRVLLIDCDLRRPTVHAAFQIRARPAWPNRGPPGDPVSRVTERLSVISPPDASRAIRWVCHLGGHAHPDRTRPPRGNATVLVDTPLAVLPDANLLADPHRWRGDGGFGRRHRLRTGGRGNPRHRQETASSARY
jgi:hypothetical protein